MSAALPNSPSAVAAPARGLVLVVDDEPLNVLLLESMLRREGYAVVVAANGAEAVERFSRERIDMVLMDVMMPEMDGYEATRHIKAACGERFVPVIFLTALADEAALTRCIEAGGDDFLVKPFKQALLSAKIHAMERIRDLHRVVSHQHAALTVAHDRALHDLRLAERVMTRAVTAPNVALDALNTFLRPAATLNGDVLLTARHPSGDLHLLLGDFTGHGLAAAIGALPVADLFRDMTARGHGMGDILRALNRKLHTLLPTDMFMAGCFVCVHHELHRVSIWNGGMPEVLVLDSAGHQIRARVPSTHLPLGIRTDSAGDLVPEVLSMAPGDHLLVYSDGLIEAQLPSGEQFGVSRLEHLVATSATADAFFPMLQECLQTLCELGAPADDVTVVDLPWGPALLPAATRAADPGVPGRTSRCGAWCWALELQAESLRHIDPIPLALAQLELVPGGQAHRASLYTIVSELFNNALDHGVLGIDSRLKHSPEGFAYYYAERTRRLAGLHEGYVRMEFVHVPQPGGGRLILSLQDSGPGFNADAVLARAAAAVDTPAGLSGRGVALVKNLCESLVYHGSGNRVEAVFAWTA
jgi:CheY-like chemotaxis protein